MSTATEEKELLKEKEPAGGYSTIEKKAEDEGKNEDEEEEDVEAQGDDDDDESSVPVRFDWPVYVDATLAGLSVLIPLPFVDNIFERLFRRRMVAAIAKRRKVTMDKDRVNMVNNRRSIIGCISDCAFFPFFIVMELVISLFKILVYCCTIKKSTDALNYYWQRAFLMDYMLQRGYLSDSKEQAEAAIVAMEHLLDDVGASPLERLARKIVYGPCRIFFSVVRYVCRGGVKEDSSIDQTQATMSESWTSFSVYFKSLAKRYEAELEKSQRPRSASCFCFRPSRLCCKKEAIA